MRLRWDGIITRLSYRFNFFLGLLAGQYVFSVIRSPTIRLVVALLFAAPAAWAGYEVTLSLVHIGISSEWWREAFALFGSVVVGCTAWARVATLATPVLREGVGAGAGQSPLGPSLGSVTRDG